MSQNNKYILFKCKQNSTINMMNRDENEAQFTKLIMVLTENNHIIDDNGVDWHIGY